MEIFLFVPLTAIGFFLLADHPLWILLLFALNAVVVLLSYALYRRDKARNLSRLLIRGFLALALLLLAGSFVGAALTCTYDPDPFCLFGAAPFLAGAVTAGFFALVTRIIDWIRRKKKRTVTSVVR